MLTPIPEPEPLTPGPLPPFILQDLRFPGSLVWWRRVFFRKSGPPRFAFLSLARSFRLQTQPTDLWGLVLLVLHQAIGELPFAGSCFARVLHQAIGEIPFAGSCFASLRLAGHLAFETRDLAFTVWGCALTQRHPSNSFVLTWLQLRNPNPGDKNSKSSNNWFYLDRTE